MINLSAYELQRDGALQTAWNVIDAIRTDALDGTLCAVFSDELLDAIEEIEVALVNSGYLIRQYVVSYVVEHRADWQPDCRWYPIQQFGDYDEALECVAVQLERFSGVLSVRVVSKVAVCCVRPGLGTNP